MPATISVDKQPVNGRQAASATAILLTQIVASAGATTFTNTTVVDAGAWTLTNVAAGHIVKVLEADGTEYRGAVKEVAGATITVFGWKRGGVSGRGMANMTPTDGRQAFVLKVDRCKKLLVDALDANTADVYLGFNSSVAVSGSDAGHPIAPGAGQANHRLTVEADLQEVIDLGNVYIIAPSAQNVSYIAM